MLFFLDSQLFDELSFVGNFYISVLSRKYAYISIVLDIDMYNRVCFYPFYTFVETLFFRTSIGDVMSNAFFSLVFLLPLLFLSVINYFLTIELRINGINLMKGNFFIEAG